MAVFLYIPSAFDRFPDEAKTIGRLVTEYGVLEYDFCLLVAAVTGDMDAAVKAMYRVSGEKARLDVGDALARRHVLENRRQMYEMTYARLNDCRKVRNTYAHAQWVDTVGNGLCFVDLESWARSSVHVTSAAQQLYRVTRDLLAAQARMFYEVSQNLRYLNMEAQAVRSGEVIPDVHLVDPIATALRPEQVPADATPV